MNYGFIKAAACTPEIVVADCIHNAQAILDLMKKSAAEGVRLAVFPELCLTGYTCGDLFTQQTLLESVKQNLLKLAEESRSLQMISVIGAPIAHYGKLYNCGVVLYGGKFWESSPKRKFPIMPNFMKRETSVPLPKRTRTVRIGEDEIPFGKDCSSVVTKCPNLFSGLRSAKTFGFAGRRQPITP